MGIRLYSDRNIFARPEREIYSRAMGDRLSKFSEQKSAGKFVFRVTRSERIFKVATVSTCNIFSFAFSYIFIIY